MEITIMFVNKLPQVYTGRLLKTIWSVLSEAKHLEVPYRWLPRLPAMLLKSTNSVASDHSSANAVGSFELIRHRQRIFTVLLILFMTHEFHLVFQREYFQRTSKHSWNVIEIFPWCNIKNDYQPSTLVSFKLLHTARSVEKPTLNCNAEDFREAILMWHSQLINNRMTLTIHITPG